MGFYLTIGGISAVLAFIGNPASAQQIDCGRLGNAVASEGIYTDQQKQEMSAVYSRECSGQQAEPAAPPEPPSLTFTIHNKTGSDLEVTFKSEHRDAWWPGNGNVYILRNGLIQNYRLNCFAGERICYGASKNFFITAYWGAGATQEYHCVNCCYICGPGAETGVIGLTP